MTSSPPNFDRVAHIYRWAEWLSLGPLLERTREHYLPQLADPRRALVLGDGDGRFLAALLQANPSLNAVAVDTSATMLSLLRKRSHQNATRLRTQQTSALNANTPSGTDLIITHFLLDCFTQDEVDALTLRLAAQTAPGTLWLLSDFALPHSPILRGFAALYIRGLYLAFRILTGLRVTRLPNPQRALQHAGFERIEHHERLGGLLYTELWRRLESRVCMNAPETESVPDPIPPSEPAVPSLPGPDPGVFHHNPAPLPITPALPAEDLR